MVAEELPYDSSPANEAIILYVPSVVGIQDFPKVPEYPSVVTAPISTYDPSSPIAVNITKTPVIYFVAPRSIKLVAGNVSFIHGISCLSLRKLLSKNVCRLCGQTLSIETGTEKAKYGLNLKT